MQNYFQRSIVSVFIIGLCYSANAQIDLKAPLTKFTLESDNDFWLRKEESQVVNLVSYFKALTNVNEQHERFSMNLSIVIDRSGSMQGEKLEKTKEAVNYLLKQLQPNDIVSVVAYESGVQVIVEPQKVTNVHNLIRLINKIESDGSTFLSGGMEKGYELINSVKDTLQNPKYVHRVVLLSDGLANEGIIDPQALARIAAKNLQEKNISLSTLGIGGDYNEKLMTDLAISGTGNYYFVAVPSDIPKIFEQELKGVQDIVSKNTRLVIHFPENAVSLRQVHHYNYTLVGNVITFELNDVFSNNEKAFLIEFDLVKGYTGDLSFSAKLSYQNAYDNLNEVIESREYVIKETQSEKEFSASYRQIGSLTHSYLLSTEAFQLATIAAEEGNFNEAESLLTTAMEYIKVYNSRFAKHPFLEDINDTIDAYKKDLKEMQKKPSKLRNFANRGHRSYAFRTISCPAF